MTAKHNAARRVSRTSKRMWVTLSEIRTPPAGKGQRPFDQAWADHLFADFDIEAFGIPTVSHRAGLFYVLNGQHRIDALKRWLGEGWERQQIECEVYENLTEAEEADKFDSLNTTKSASAYWKFTNRLTAGHESEVAIHGVLASLGLSVSPNKSPGSIGAVSTLCRVFARSDSETLRRSLRIIRDSYGDPGFETAVIDGIAHLCQRYNGAIDEDVAVAKLSKSHGGVNGLLAKADILKKQTGNSKAHCVAAAAVDTINSGRGGNKLPTWWKTSIVEEFKPTQ
jgi:hypothetical protein